MKEEEENIHLVKRVSQELGLTYKELANELGCGEGILKNSVYNNTLSKQLHRAIELYIENINLKKEIEKTKNIKILLKDFING